MKKKVLDLRFVGKTNISILSKWFDIYKRIIGVPDEILMTISQAEEYLEILQREEITHPLIFNGVKIKI